MPSDREGERPEIVRQLLAGLQNALDLARYGRLSEPGHLRFSIEQRDDIGQLRRYTGARAQRKARPALLLVPPLMAVAEVYDVGPERSAVALLLERGIDVWLLDFGAPERQPGGLERSLSDHVLALSRAIDCVRKATRRDVHLGGYSQGGIFCYLAAALRSCDGVASIVSFGSPVDTRRALLPGVPDKLAASLIDQVARGVELALGGSALPAWGVRRLFQLMAPAKDLRARSDFLMKLHDRDALVRGEPQRRFVGGEAWVAFPGPALRDFVQQFLAQNRLLHGGLVIGDRAVSLADLKLPILAMIGELDEIARPAGIHALREAAPHADLHSVSVRAGHLGLVVSEKAMSEVWPTVADWLHWREGRGKRPGALAATRPERPRAARAPAPAALAVELGLDAAGWAVSSLRARLRSAEWLFENTLDQLSRLARLERTHTGERASLGRALAEWAQTHPERTAFLHEGRAHTYGAVDKRVEHVAHALIAAGVRQGERVGILMQRLPVALGAVAATSRVGAVAVLLRPEGDLAAECAGASVDYLVTDAECLGRARAAYAGRLLTLDGGASEAGPDVTDLDTAAPLLELPGWYEPNPGRAEELGLVFFSGRAGSPQPVRITHRRWALAALGAASAAALTPKDTVYCWTPIHHPTGLLVSMSAALVSGARFAVADGLSAARFWEEVRRYGASVVFYAGTVCRELVDAPLDARELHHPVRVFAGSGMPRPLWRRLRERWGPVAVAELYASSEGTAILANVSGAKIGALGRPLPGSAEVAVAAFDLETRSLARDASGFVARAGTDQAGLLLARAEPEQEVLGARVVRSVFERGDAWTASRDLMRVDADGDHWLVDHLDDLIETASGRVPSLPIEEAVWELEAVSLAAAYGLQAGSARQLPVVAVLLRPGLRLDLDALAGTVRELPPASRPALIRVADTIPMTAGYRVDKRALRALASPLDLAPGAAYAYDVEAGAYRKLDKSGLRPFTSGCSA